MFLLFTSLKALCYIVVLNSCWAPLSTHVP